MNPRPFALVAALALVLLLPGCFVARTHINDPLRPEQLEGLRPGTRAADVVEVLGAPSEVVQLGHRSAYRYDHTVEKSAMLWLFVVLFRNIDTRSDRVWIWFDRNDLLTHIGATFDADSAEYAMPWQDRE